MPEADGRHVLEAKGLSKAYDRTTALTDFAIQVPAGHMVGLVGNNGAGKSTALKLLCGLLEPTTGTATLDGAATAVPETRQKLGFLTEDSPLYEDETALSYLAFFGRLYGMAPRDSRPRAEALLRRLRLGEEHWKKPLGELSKGSARKVAIARALLHDPAVLILDEPQSGLDPQSREELDRFLQDLRNEGKAILLSAHNLPMVESLCDGVVLLHKGKTVARGTVAELRAQHGGDLSEVLRKASGA